MECEDVPVEIHNAIADWSCPTAGRVSNSRVLFQLILDDSKAHPDDYENIPKVSHPIKPADRPRLVLTDKETPRSPKAEGQTA
jgi:hypothetical protein